MARDGTLTCTSLSLLTVTAVALQMVGLGLFVFGFFPVKPALSGASGPESFLSPDGCGPLPNAAEPAHLPPPRLKSLYEEQSGIPPLFDRLVLMVVDGLPAEFVLGRDGRPPPKGLRDAMPFTQSLLSTGKAVGFHAKAAPPTVTMPRLKAMVSGAIGGFLDVAMNFNTQAMLDDNLLAQLLRIGWKMVMLGDETWLKLFPGLFMRHDGVSSFFVIRPADVPVDSAKIRRLVKLGGVEGDLENLVTRYDRSQLHARIHIANLIGWIRVKDTVQVDQNVTRHLKNELSSDDWDLLILHYLGLDHVGHIGGRNSDLMGPKLAEMDEVVKKIYLSAIEIPDGGAPRSTLLVVVSDHGMTETGNHGGSSYAETDSIAIFVGLQAVSSNYIPTKSRTIQQVDIAPTLALLLGVPIPKNNVGILISETFHSLTDDRQLRALEVNSWQLVRLVQAQLKSSPGGRFPFDCLDSSSQECSGIPEKKLCCIYMNAINLWSSCKSKKSSGSTEGDDHSIPIAAYQKFLATASEWLSRRVTDKPVSLLALGILAMVLACILLTALAIYFDREVYGSNKRSVSGLGKPSKSWCADEAFVLTSVFIVVLSMGSSSMVEEEQYIWYFLVATSYLLLLRKAVFSFSARTTESSELLEGRNPSNFVHLLSIMLLLLTGRVLRGWHQGGVNWTHLPDISKWLELAGDEKIKGVQLGSGLLVIVLGLSALSLSGSTKRIVRVVAFWFLTSGMLVVWHIMEYQGIMTASSSFGVTSLLKLIYAVVGIGTVGSVIAVPWLWPVGILEKSSKFPVSEHRESSYVIGLVYMLSWCLLQLLLQQPINLGPILLLLVQVLAAILRCSCGTQRNKEWVDLSLLYSAGMVGHFALGNSNTLATIDIAGAFIGLSSYSTLLSGILMFAITYASPMLVLLSLVTAISVKQTMKHSSAQDECFGHHLKMILGFPCLIPLTLNAILLTSYTIVLLLMRNHLFVWSVFSPKYLYVCATTVCIYVGLLVVIATEIYMFFTLSWRKRRSTRIN